MARGGSFTEEQTALIVSVLESRTIPRPKVQALIDVLRTMPELNEAQDLLTRWHLRKQGLMTSKVPASALLVRKREPGKRKKRLTGRFAGFESLGGVSHVRIAWSRTGFFQHGEGGRGVGTRSTNSDHGVEPVPTALTEFLGDLNWRGSPLLREACDFPVPIVTTFATAFAEIFSFQGRLAQCVHKIAGIPVRRLDFDPALKTVFRDGDLLADFLELTAWELRGFFTCKFVHASPPCRTWSLLARAIHLRSELNAWLGVTVAAHKANVLLAKLVSLLLGRPRGGFWSIENPDTEAFLMAPAIKWLRESGVPVYVLRWSFCEYGEPMQKKSVLLTDDPGLVQHMEAAKKECPLCRDRQSHPSHVRDMDKKEDLQLPVRWCEAYAQYLKSKLDPPPL